MINAKIFDLAYEVGAYLKSCKWRLATAESCTGGLVSAAITDIAGSSDWFDCGFVTYSNEAKMRLLDVRPQTLTTYGAVSEQTVHEMLLGALKHSQADVVLAISGVAGPSGGTPQKPVGTVCLGWTRRGQDVITTTQHFVGDRAEVRLQATVFALEALLKLS